MAVCWWLLALLCAEDSTSACNLCSEGNPSSALCQKITAVLQETQLLWKWWSYKQENAGGVPILSWRHPLCLSACWDTCRGWGWGAPFTARQGWEGKAPDRANTSTAQTPQISAAMKINETPEHWSGAASRRCRISFDEGKASANPVWQLLPAHLAFATD